MPTKSYFDKSPPFPSDILFTSLPRLSFAKLLANEKAESDALFEASRQLGFFLINLQDCDEGLSFLKKAEAMFDLNVEVHDLSPDELNKYAYKPPKSLVGYKKVGDIKIEDGRPDRFGFYTISQDDIMGTSWPISHPPCIEFHRPEIKSYMEQAHSVISLICSHLDSQLHLAKGTLASLQSMACQSGTSLRMLRYPPQPSDDLRTSLAGHTDIGSLTILFNITGGLQILLPGAAAGDPESWVYVKPEAGHAIINLGETMVEWSAGILRSNMHRVTFAPGEQGKLPRYSLAYLVRPSEVAPMKRLAGGGSLIPELEEGEEDTIMSANEWAAHKSLAIMSGRDFARSRGGMDVKLSVKSDV